MASYKGLNESRFVEVLNIICENIGEDWIKLARSLGLSDSDIRLIVRGTDSTVPSEQCWEALCKWRQAVPKGKQLMLLSHALMQCKQKRLADLTKKLMEQTDQRMDDILTPHMEREDKMLEAMYIIVDLEATHWRNIAKLLGLSDNDLINLQKKFGPRTREKCMHALYKWRHTVYLSEYKIANLVMALKACGLERAAELVKRLPNETPKVTIRKEYSDEILMNIDVKELDVEKYTPVPSSTPRGEQTPRPKNSLPQEALIPYLINKLFFYLLDILDTQDSKGAHPLVYYLWEKHKGKISEVNRKGSFIAVRFADARRREEVKKLIKSGEMSGILTQCLITERIKQEIGLEKVHLDVRLL